MSAAAQSVRLWLRRFAAAASVALVLLLAASAASPTLHHWWHDGATTDANDDCAVVLFAGGLTITDAAVAIAGPTIAWRRVRVAIVENLCLTAPRHLLPLGRGPPGC